MITTIINFKKMNNVSEIQTTLFEIVLRDATQNPEYYKDTSVIEDLTGLHHVLGEIIKHEVVDDNPD
jgi:hypothetical protein